MGRRHAWVLNFDAEDELASRSAALARTPTAATKERMRALEGRVPELLAPGDVVIDGDGAGARSLGDYEGRAWCPTPSALERMRAAGARVPAAPSIDVLRRVNARAFSSELGQTLPGAVLATSIDDAARAVSSGGDWLLKRAFGFAGRGRRKVRALTREDIAWIEASLRQGALQIEPWVSIALDVAMHGHVSASGAFVLGVPTVQLCDAHGAWAKSERDAPLEPQELRALEANASEVARALAAAGYFGPFGVDAYRWRDARDACGELHFNARGEINARYTMGWAIGMRDVRDTNVA